MMSAETAQPKPNESNEKKTRNRRPGRSSRRRKRKAQAILDAAEAAVAGAASTLTSTSTSADAAATATATATSAATVVPSDRSHTLEGVKARRREERKRRLPENSAAPVGDGSSGDDADALLDPKDEHALRFQLGFIPGNAVCVAARLPVELDLSIASGSSSSSSSSANNQKDAGQEEEQKGSTNDSPQKPDNDYVAPPSVLKLYPMAVRESYKGGKSDGRAFKGRRRGAMRVEGKDGEKNNDGKSADVDDTNNTKSDNKRKERAWIVESSTQQSGQASEREGADQKDASSNDKEASNQEQVQKQQQIIEPFPTLYWLTSPLLRTQISKIEISKTHSVPKMEERLRSDPKHLEQMERAHKSYGTKRWELLTSQDQNNINERGWKAALDDSRGVAGIRLKNGRYDCVKCLHAHAAHYLAQVSEWMEEEQRKGEDVETGTEPGEEKNKKQWGNGDNEESGAVASWEGCDRDDLNLVGKWTMEAVFDAVLGSNNKDSKK